MGQTFKPYVDILNDKNRIEFADMLFCEEDYFRANQEYRVVLSRVNNDTLRFKLGYSLIKMGKLDEGIDNLKGLFFNSDLVPLARFEFYRGLFFGGKFGEFRSNYDSRRFFPSEYSMELSRLYGISLLLDGSKNIGGLSPEDIFPEGKIELGKDLFNRFRNEKRIDPVTSAALSALIPGSGKIYAGEISDGIASLAYIGLLAILSSNNFSAGHDFRGYLFGGLALYFYAGNIYGSYAAADKINRQIEIDYRLELESILNEHNYFLPLYEFLCD